MAEDIFSNDNIARANAYVRHLQHNLNIANADHIALWLEEHLNDDTGIGWLACRIVEAHEAAIRAQADEIARLREALGMAKDLLDCIVQTPGNTWYVSADDPEAAVCDTYSAIDAVLQHKEPQP